MAKRKIKAEKPNEELPPSVENIYAAELIAAYKNGDKRAFGMLCSIYRKWMLTKNYFYYKSDVKAEEATDDQLLILSDNILEGWYVEQFKFEGYLRNLVRNNQHIDVTELKTIEYNENSDYNDGEDNWDDVLFDGGLAFVLDRNEGDDLDFEKMIAGFSLFEPDDFDKVRIELIYTAIDTLSKDDRDIIEMRNLHKLSWKLIAGIFKVKEKSMSGRYKKIFKKIKKIMGIKK